MGALEIRLFEPLRIRRIDQEPAIGRVLHRRPQLLVLALQQHHGGQAVDRIFFTAKHRQAELGDQHMATLVEKDEDRVVDHIFAAFGDFFLGQIRLCRTRRHGEECGASAAERDQRSGNVSHGCPDPV